MSEGPVGGKPEPDVYTVLLILATVLMIGATIFLAVRSAQLFGHWNPFSGAQLRPAAEWAEPRGAERMIRRTGESVDVSLRGYPTSELLTHSSDRTGSWSAVRLLSRRGILVRPIFGPLEGQDA